MGVCDVVLLSISIDPLSRRTLTHNGVICIFNIYENVYDEVSVYR